MKKILMVVLVAVTTSFGLLMLSPVAVSAATKEECQAQFLTFRPWYYGLVDVDGEGKCKITPPESSSDGVVKFVWTIVLNILSILLSVVGYLALGFLVAGGYFYVLARGDPTKIAKGKRTIISAIIGLIICILASLIVNMIVDIITGATSA